MNVPSDALSFERQPRTNSVSHHDSLETPVLSEASPNPTGSSTSSAPVMTDSSKVPSNSLDHSSGRSPPKIDSDTRDSVRVGDETSDPQSSWESPVIAGFTAERSARVWSLLADRALDGLDDHDQVEFDSFFDPKSDQKGAELDRSETEHSAKLGPSLADLDSGLGAAALDHIVAQLVVTEFFPPRRSQSVNLAGPAGAQGQQTHDELPLQTALPETLHNRLTSIIEQWPQLQNTGPSIAHSPATAPASRVEVVVGAVTPAVPVPLLTGAKPSEVSAVEPPSLIPTSSSAARSDAIEATTPALRLVNRTVAWGGWLVAAALLLVVAWPSSPPEPTLACQRLIQEEGDNLLILDWVDPNGGQLTGDVVWSQTRQTGFMRFANIAPNNPSIEQYQLWIFDRQRSMAHPVDGGLFDVTATTASRNVTVAAASGSAASTQRGSTYPSSINKAQVQAQVVVPITPKIRVHDASWFAVTIEPPGGVVVSDRRRIAAIARPPNFVSLRTVRLGF